MCKGYFLHHDTHHPTWRLPTDVENNRSLVMQTQLSVVEIKGCTVAMKETVDKLEGIISKQSVEYNNACKELDKRVTNVEREIIKCTGGK